MEYGSFERDFRLVGTTEVEPEAYIPLNINEINAVNSNACLLALGMTPVTGAALIMDEFIAKSYQLDDVPYYTERYKSAMYEECLS